MNRENQILQVLNRGVAEVLPDAQSLAKKMAERKIRLYLGIDPTGSVLTLGHAVVLRKLQQFANLGHEVILLIGNGTVRIGDPTGRDSTRPMLSDDEIKENFANWKKQAAKVLNFDQITVMYNGDWLDKLTYADMVNLMAQTTVQQLMERDMFQDRVAKGLPIYGHEIMYPLLQGFDSVAMEVDLEIGGTDQTFNMMMGRHLLKVYKNKDKWVLSTPIINGLDGRKMSKSFNNFVALTEEADSMFGKLMSIADDQIFEYFTVLTDLSDTEINAMRQEVEKGENPMHAKKHLAWLITSMYHSTAAADAAQDTFERVVQGREVPEEMQVVTTSTQTISARAFIVNTFAEESSSQVRRMIEQGAVKIIKGKIHEAEIVTDPDQEIEIPDDGLVLKYGKRRFVKITKQIEE